MTGGDTAPMRALVDDAIADLGAIRSSDPAARHAVHAIGLTRITLESFWVDALRADGDVDGR